MSDLAIPKEEEVSDHKEELVGSAKEVSTLSPKREGAMGTKRKGETGPRRRDHVKVEYESIQESVQEHKGPVKWQEAYSLIQKQREQVIAPVDSMQSSEQLADGDASEAVKRFQILVTLMLSSQTRDEVSN